jgi:hypothetical protein
MRKRKRREDRRGFTIKKRDKEEVEGNGGGQRRIERQSGGSENENMSRKRRVCSDGANRCADLLGKDEILDMAR